MHAAGTIILPIAGQSSRFPGLRPKWMLTAPSGELMLELSLRTIPDWRDRRVVIGGLENHLKDQHGETAIRRALGDKVEIVSFSQPTTGPAETVFEIIQRANVTGPIFIKDCDSWFDTTGNIFGDVVCFADLRTTAGARNIPGKSFVSLNESGLVEGIVEKSVSSNFISVGGYGFHDANVFVESYERLIAQRQSGELFVSHVILEAMHRGAVFCGVESLNYEDVGTLEAWNAFRRRRRAYFIDLDGVVLKNAGEYISPLWEDPDQALPGNVEVIKALAAAGAQLIFVTARPERFREKTERFLKELGLTWHAAIFGVSHSSRILINDYAASNPYPSAIAVNVARNDDALKLVIPREEL